MKKALEPLTGAILSIASFETWENIFLSAIIALVGGFMAALGKTLYEFLKEKIAKKQNNAHRLPK